MIFPPASRAVVAQASVGCVNDAAYPVNTGPTKPRKIVRLHLEQCGMTHGFGCFACQLWIPTGRLGAWRTVAAAGVPSPTLRVPAGRRVNPSPERERPRSASAGAGRSQKRGLRIALGSASRGYVICRSRPRSCTPIRTRPCPLLPCSTGATAAARSIAAAAPSFPPCDRRRAYHDGENQHEHIEPIHGSLLRGSTPPRARAGGTAAMAGRPPHSPAQGARHRQGDS